jgi:hypothetical protein
MEGRGPPSYTLAPRTDPCQLGAWKFDQQPEAARCLGIDSQGREVTERISHSLYKALSLTRPPSGEGR